MVVEADSTTGFDATKEEEAAEEVDELLGAVIVMRASALRRTNSLWRELNLKASVILSRGELITIRRNCT